MNSVLYRGVYSVKDKNGNTLYKTFYLPGESREDVTAYIKKTWNGKVLSCNLARR